MASITDYLKSKGFTDSSSVAPFFDTKKKVYENLGLGTDFRGTAEQNTSLLSELSRREKTAGVSLNPSNIFTVISGTKTPTTQGPQFTPAGGVGSRTTVGNVNYLFTSTGWKAVQSAAKPQPVSVPVSPQAPVTAQNRPVERVSVPQVKEPSSGEVQVPETAEEEVPAYLRGLVAQAYRPSPTAEELSQKAIEKFTGGATFPLEQEASQAQKAATELKAQRDKEEFISNLASRGLIFSGRKETGLKTIEADKLSDLLGIDRKFALLVAQGLETAAQDIAKEAQKGNEDAISTLDKLGYILADGTLVRKPSEVRAEAAAERSASSEERAIRSAERAEERLELSQEAAQRAEESASRAAERFEQEQTGTRKLSSSIVNKALISGVPISVSDEIYGHLQDGNDLETIRGILSQKYGTKGASYLDKFMPALSSGSDREL